MTKPRAEQVNIPSTPFYHCMVRCVRRAFLFGDDHVTGKNYDHRKQWIVSRLRFLSYVYAIDICAYSVMCNHYHVVLHVDEARAKAWTDREVAERWMQLFNGNVLVKRWLKSETSTEAEIEKVQEVIELWRERLTSVSWFMRCMNECIATMANAEDDVKGRFWEGRFKSQALLDEAAVLTCMAYVDLNPVRAKMADSLETSDFTSLQQRLFEVAQRSRKPKTESSQQLVGRVKRQKKVTKKLGFAALPVAGLMPFDGSVKTLVSVALPFTQEDYFALVESAGQVIRGDKRGYLVGDGPPVLARLGIDETQWISQIRQYGDVYGYCVGGVEKMDQYAQATGRAWVQGVGAARVLFGKLAA